MFPEIEDWDLFKQRVELICSLILSCIGGYAPSLHLISIDEKTGIQALERKSMYPMTSGKILRKEYEYQRHGTTCLMAALDVGSGKLNNHRLHATRTEEDFLVFVKQICEKISKQDQIIFLLDQLNIHKSESLVNWIATQIGFKQDLGIKGFKGILKNQETRMEFLENTQHRIRFVYTPKHCSWLNPIEIWFGRLQRQVIKKGNFNSVDQLIFKIKRYISFYNKFLSKPYKWKFTGFIKSYKLTCTKLTG